MARIFQLGEPQTESEKVAISHLRGCLDDQFDIYHNLEFPDGRRYAEVDLVVAGPGGMFAIDVKEISGAIRGYGARWYIHRPVGSHDFPSPVQKIRHRARQLKSLLVGKDLSTLRQVEVTGLVVLTSGSSVIEDLPETEVRDVVRLDDLTALLESVPRRSTLHANDWQQVRSSLRKVLEGSRARTAGPAVVGDYVIRERLGDTPLYTEYRASHQAAPAATVILHVYNLDRYAPGSEVRQQHDRALVAFKALQTMPSHRGVVGLRGVGAHGEYPFLVLEDAAGSNWFASRALLDIEARFDRIEEGLEALGHLHAHGVLHRNMNPGCLLVDAQGRTRLTHMDWARIDRSLAESVAHLVVRDADRRYTAWEADSGEFTPAADVFSFGIVAYEFLVSGQDTGSKAVLGSTGAFPHPASRLLSNAPAGLDEWLQALVAPVPAARPSAHDAAASLRLIRAAARRTPTADHENLPPDYLFDGHFEVECRLGRPGVFAAAYRVRDIFGGVTRVLKVLLRDPVSIPERLVAEYQTLCRLPLSKHVVRVLHGGRAERENAYYLLFEHVGGDTVQTLIHEELLAPSDRVQVAVDLIAALQHLHGHQVAHGDLQWHNVIWTGTHAVLIDFNLASQGDRARQQQDIAALRQMLSELFVSCNRMQERADAAGFLEQFAGALARAGAADGAAHALDILASQLGYELRKPESASSDKPARNYNLAGVWAEFESHLALFSGRTAFLAQIESSIDGAAGGEYIIIEGPPGQGKSAIMAALAERMGVREPADTRRAFCLLHMIKSHGDPRRILQFLIFQAAQHSGRPIAGELMEGTLPELRNVLIGLLEQLASMHGKVVVILDALDEVASDGRSLDFLPPALPPGVRCVMSTRPDLVLVHTIQRKLQRTRTIRLPGMAGDDLTALAGQYLGEHYAASFAALPAATDLLVKTGGVALFLRRALERLRDRFLRSSGTSSAPESLSAAFSEVVAEVPNTLDELFEQLYDEVTGAEGHEGLSARKGVLQVLSVVREPISDAEIAAVLSAAGRSLTQDDVRTATRFLSPFLLSHPGYRFVLFHAEFSRFLRERVLGPVGQYQLHAAINGSLAAGGDGAWSVYALRHGLAHDRETMRSAVSANLPVEAAAGRQELRGRLGAWSFIAGAIKGGMLGEVRRELRELHRAGSILDEGARETVRLWLQFLDQNHHRFGGDPAVAFGWMMNAPGESPVHACAEGAPPQQRGGYLRVGARLGRRTPHPPYTVLSGHDRPVKAIRFSRDGAFLISTCGHEVVCWQMPDATEVARIALNEKTVSVMEVAPTNHLLLGTDGGLLRRHSLPDLRLDIEAPVCVPHGIEAINWLRFAPLILGAEGKLYCCVGDFDQIVPMPHQFGKIHILAVSDFWIAASDDSRILVDNMFARELFNGWRQIRGAADKKVEIYLHQIATRLEGAPDLSEALGWVPSIVPARFGSWWAVDDDQLVLVEFDGAQDAHDLGWTWAENYGTSLRAMKLEGTASDPILSWGSTGFSIIDGVAGEILAAADYPNLADAALSANGKTVAGARESEIPLWSMDSASPAFLDRQRYRKLRYDASSRLLIAERLAEYGDADGGVEVFVIDSSENPRLLTSLESGSLEGIMAKPDGVQLLMTEAREARLLHITPTGDWTTVSTWAFSTRLADSRIAMDIAARKTLTGDKSGMYWEPLGSPESKVCLTSGDFSHSTARVVDERVIVAQLQGRFRYRLLSVLRGNVTLITETDDTIWKITADADSIYTGHLSGAVRRWSSAGGIGTDLLAPGGQWREHSVTVLELSPSGRRLLAGGLDGRIWLWDAVTHSLLARHDLDTHVRGCAFLSEDTVAISTDDEIITFRLVLPAHALSTSAT